MRAVASLFLLLAASLLQPAVAGTPETPDQRVQTFAQSKFYKALLDHAVGSVPPVVFTRCPSLVSNDSKISVITEVTFDSQGMPVSGMWRHSFPISGCGNDTVLNFFFFASGAGQYRIVFGVPGSTLASPGLQRQVVPLADANAGRKVKDCHSFVVTSTRFEAYRAAPAATKAQPAWWETWTLNGCGHSVTVPLDFTPDAKGVRVSPHTG